MLVLRNGMQCQCAALPIRLPLSRYDVCAFPFEAASQFCDAEPLPFVDSCSYDVCDLCGALLASDIEQLASPHLASGESGSGLPATPTCRLVVAARRMPAPPLSTRFA